MDNLHIKFKDRIFFIAIKYIIVMIIWLIYLTCRVNFTTSNFKDKPCVVVFWHGRITMMSFAYRHWWGKNRKGKVIISNHKDGEIIASAGSLFGIEAIRGSSSKGGARALMNSFKEIKNGVDVIITPDGPRGPKHSIADGAVAISQKKDLKVYSLNYEASRFWKFKSWDEMILPKPFSVINFSLSEPIDLTGLSMDDAKELIHFKLNEQSRQDSKFS